jgi:hypothetical protein
MSPYFSSSSRQIYTPQNLYSKINTYSSQDHSPCHYPNDHPGCIALPIIIRILLFQTAELIIA